MHSSLSYHINKYEERLNRNFFDDWNVEQFPNIKIFPDGTFFTWAIRLDCIEFGPSVCNMKLALALGLLWAKAINKPYLRAITVRNPKAYARAVGGSIKFAAYDDDIPVWCIEKEVK